MLNDKNKSCSRRLWCIGEEFLSLSLIILSSTPLFSSFVVFLHYHYPSMHSFLLNMLFIMLLQAINIFSELKRSLEVKVKCLQGYAHMFELFFRVSLESRCQCLPPQLLIPMDPAVRHCSCFVLPPFKIYCGNDIARGGVGKQLIVVME